MGPDEKHQRFGGWESKITYPTQSKHWTFYSEVIGLVQADYSVHVASFIIYFKATMAQVV